MSEKIHRYPGNPKKVNSPEMARQLEADFLEEMRARVHVSSCFLEFPVGYGGAAAVVQTLATGLATQPAYQQRGFDRIQVGVVSPRYHQREDTSVGIGFYSGILPEAHINSIADDLLRTINDQLSAVGSPLELPPLRDFNAHG